MLIAAAPFALKRAAEDRHSYQASVVDAISDVIAEADKRYKVQVDEAKVAIAAFEAEQASAGTVLEQIQAGVVERLECSQAKDAIYKAASEVRDGAGKSLDEARAAESALAERTKAKTEEKAALETDLRELWGPLRSGSTLSNQEGLPPAQLRTSRAKNVSQVQKIFAQIGAPKSLSVAVAIAFKTKVDARGEFASAAVEQGEAAIVAHLAALGTALGASDSEAAEAAGAVQAAEAVLAAAKTGQDDAFVVAAQAQNELVAEQSKEHDHKKAMKGFSLRAKELAASLVAAERVRDGCADIAAKFHVLKMGSRPTPAGGDDNLATEAGAAATGSLVAEEAASVCADTPCPIMEAAR